MTNQTLLQKKESSQAFSISDFFQLLSLALHFPTKELVDAIADGSFKEDVVAILEKLNCGLKEITEIKKLFETYGNDIKDGDPLLHEMSIELTRLCYHPHTPVLDIYETTFNKSINEKEKSALFISKQAIAAEQCYKDAGLKLKTNDPADHLITELEFMMAMYARKGRAIQEQNEEALQKINAQITKFQNEHLGKWAIQFFEKLEEESTLPIYKIIGKAGIIGLSHILFYQ